MLTVFSYCLSAYSASSENSIKTKEDILVDMCAAGMAGGCYSVISVDEFNLCLTGDIHALMQLIGLIDRLMD